ncbi:hypothetical protein [Desulfonauticus submarinus]
MNNGFNLDSLEEINKLVSLYLQARGGKSFPGFIHNLNNYLHLLKMQHSLLEKRIQKETLEDIPVYFERFAQAFSGVDRLVSLAGERDFYLSKEIERFSINSFIEWFKNFWVNDLFFKHQIKLNVCLNIDFSLQLAPYILTFCLEEGLFNILEELQDKEKTFELSLNVNKVEQDIIFELISPTVLKVKNPFDPFVSTKKKHLGLGLFLGAKILSTCRGGLALFAKHGLTIYQIFIPIKN